MKKNDSTSLDLKILVGLPNIQDQLRLVDRQVSGAREPDLATWKDLGNLLAELYSQLQSRQRVTIHRFSQRSKTKDPGPRRAR